MTDGQFDAFLTSLARARTRREMLAAVAATSTAAAALGAAAVDAASGSCRGPHRRCKKGRQCCSGGCHKRHGKKRGRCRCSGEGHRCVDASDCCHGQFCDMTGTCQLAND